MRSKLIATILTAHALVSPAYAEIIGMQIDRSASEEEMKLSLRKIRLADEKGAMLDLNSIMNNGKPTLVTLWAHWCLNCRAEIPGYKSIAKACPDKWNVVFVSARSSDFPKDIARYKTFNLPWTFYHVVEPKSDDKDGRNTARAFYGATADDGIITPLHYLISRTGKVDVIVNAKMDFESPEKLKAFCTR